MPLAQRTRLVKLCLVPLASGPVVLGFPAFLVNTNRKALRAGKVNAHEYERL